MADCIHACPEHFMLTYPSAGSDKLTTLELNCPALTDSKIPPVPQPPIAIKPMHPPIAAMLKENCKEAALLAAEARDREARGLKDDTTIPAVYRPF